VTGEDAKWVEKESTTTKGRGKGEKEEDAFRGQRAKVKKPYTMNQPRGVKLGGRRGGFHQKKRGYPERRRDTGTLKLYVLREISSKKHCLGKTEEKV